MNQTVHAGLYNFTSRIATSDSAVTVGSPYAEATVSSNLMGGSGLNVKRFGYITFGVDQHSKDYFASMDVEITIKIEKWLGATYLGDSIATMKLYYDPTATSEKDGHSLYIENMDSYKVTIQQIKVNGTVSTTLPKLLFLNLNLYLENYYEFDNASTPITIDSMATIDVDCDGINDLLRIYWPMQQGVEEYQFEWSFVNDYSSNISTNYLSPSQLKANFKDNSTRISTFQNYFDISMIYDHGYLVYRVRGLGRDLSNGVANLDKIIFGVWSASDISTIDLLPTLSSYHNQQAFEKGVNWQYTASFAEEGKHKEVLSFADGTLRNRQMVTKINTEGNIVVGETVYDHQGRPAVQILPAPVQPTPCSGSEAASLKYYPNFNLSETDQTKFAAKHFDLGDTVTNSCISSGDMLSTQSGASQYYSLNNWDQSGINAYIPDAGKLPYTRTEFTNDNTGRIRRQSGVGEDYQLDGGKETKYYYGAVDILPLKKLFGNEFGYGTYYQKKMVIDPNGQVSVSFTDNLDRTIATALAGDAPLSLNPIASATTAGDSIETELFEKHIITGEDLINTLNAGGDAKEFHQTFLVSSAGNFKFDYNLSFSNFKDSCLLENVCFDCIYDFSMRIEDECGDNLLAGMNLERKMGRFELDSANHLILHTECMTTDSVFNKNFTLYLPVGSYKLSKVLKVNNEAKYAYLNKYLDTNFNHCIKTIDDFIEEYTDAINYENCSDNIDCDSCLILLGSLNDFATNGGTAEEYYAKQAECKSLCQEFSYCDIQREMLLADMFIGGQYADFSDLNGQISVSAFPLSIFNTANSLPKNNANWKNPQIKIGSNWINGYYQSDSITRSKIELQVTLTGTTISSSFPEVDDLNDILIETNGQVINYYIYPEKLKFVKDFIQYYSNNDSWSSSLLYYHPEYGLYRSCLDYKSTIMSGDAYTSESFDNLLMRTDTWDKAVQRGFIKSNYASIPNANDRIENWFASSSSHPWDPFVVYGMNASTPNIFVNYGDSLKNKFNSYVDTLGQTLSVVELATAISRCPTYLSSVNTIPCVNDLGIDVIPGNTIYNDSIRNQEWILMRQFYWSLKNSFMIRQAKFKSVNASDVEYLGFNGCIGNSNFNNSAFNFVSADMTGQPCKPQTAILYKNKTLRFGEVGSYLGEMPNSVNQSFYLQTGICPKAFAEQHILMDIFSNGSIISSQSNVNLYTSFSGYFLGLKDYNFSGPIPVAEYEVLSSGLNHVTAQIKTAQEILDEIKLEKFPSATFAWSDITEIVQLKPTFLYAINGQPGYAFTLYIKQNNGSAIVLDSLKGRTTINIKSCEFEPQCEKNDFLVSMQNLLMPLSLSGDIISLTPLQIMGGVSTNYDNYINPLILQKMGNINATTAYWELNTSELSYFLKESPSATSYLALRVLYSLPTNYAPSSTPVLGQINLKGDHYFTIESLNPTTLQKEAEYYCVLTYHDALGNDTPINVGRCTDLDLIGLNCNSDAALNYRDLNALLKKQISEQGITTGGWDLFAGNQLDGVGECILDYTQTSNNFRVSSVDTLSVVGADSLRVTMVIDSGVKCPLLIQYEVLPGKFFNSDSIVEISDLIPTGNIQMNGSYRAFLIPFQMINNGVIVYDTLSGMTECLDIMICTPCLDTIYTDDLFCKDKYMDYLADYSMYINIQPQLTCGDYQDLLPVISYVEFSERNLCCSDNVAKYWTSVYQGTNCQEDVDSTYADCGIEYTELTECQEFYYEYVKAVAEVNSSPWGALNSTLNVEFGDFNEFISSGFCYCVTPYKAYLQPYMSALPNATLDPLMDLSSVCPGSIYYGDDTCGIAYNKYIEKYYQFADYSLENSTCSNFNSTVPMLSYDQFVERGSCCNLDNIFLFGAWMTVQLDTNSCPTVQLSYMDTCSRDFTSNSACINNYSKYVNAVLAYNESAWRLANDPTGLTLDSYELILDRNQCHCIGVFADKLQVYINALSSTTLPDPPNLKSFIYCDFPLSEYDEPCEKLYSKYVGDYLETMNGTVIGSDGNPGPICSPPPHLYSYQDFIDNGICCSMDNMLLTYSTFIQAYDNPSSCPTDDLPVFDSCSTDLSNDCLDHIADLINAINDYNASPYAVANQMHLNYPDDVFFESLIGNSQGTSGLAGKMQAQAQSTQISISCDCIPFYIAHLDSFTVAASSPYIGEPQTIESFTGCPKAQSDSICVNKYDVYVNFFSEYSEKNNDGTPKEKPLTYQQYQQQGLCNCVEDYVFYILDEVAITQANPAIKLNIDNLQTFCKPKSYTISPCNTGTYPIVFPDSLPTYTEGNPCANILEGVAVANAYNAYNQYIDGITQSFLTDYTRKCMQTVENMTKSFVNREYHYTLYYYDQSGTLIRTIPPEGVQLLSFNSSTHPLYQQLNNDLIYGTHTVLTDHKMATTYEYNSLGQLIRQTMPDHDKMDIWTLALPNGLHKDLSVSAIQMVSASSGYLAGNVSEAGKERGLFYKTTDGGQNWQRITSIVAPGLKKIIFPTDATGNYLNTGYAITQHGILLKSEDAGSSWDMLNTFSTNQVLEFEDVSFKNAAEGIITCPNGLIVNTNDGGQTFTVQSILPLPANVEGTFVKLKNVVAQTDAAAYFTATVEKNGMPMDVLIKDTNAVRSLVPFKAEDLLSVSLYSDTAAFIGGKNILLHANYNTSNGEPVIRTIDADFKGHLYDVIFLDKDRGVAKLANLPYLSTGKLIYTEDGGHHWNTLVDSLVFVQLNVVQRTSGYVVIQAPAYGNQLFEITISKLNPPSVRQLISFPQAKIGQLDGYIMIFSDVVQKPNTGEYFVTQSMNDGYFVKSQQFNNTENSINWNSHFDNIQSIPIGTSDSYIKFKSIVHNGKIQTIALTTDYKIHHLESDFNGTYSVVQQLDFNNGYYHNFAFDKDSKMVYTYNVNDRKFYTYDVVTQSFTALSATALPGTSGIWDYSIDYRDHKVILVGKNGKIASVLNSNTSPQLVENENIYPSSINGLDMNAKKWVMIGMNNGKYADFRNNYTHAILSPLEEEIGNVNSISSSGNSFYLAGDNGLAYYSRYATVTQNHPYLPPLTFELLFPPSAINYLPTATIKNVYPTTNFKHVASSKGTIYLFDDAGNYFYGVNGGLSFKSSGVGLIPSSLQTLPSATSNTPYIVASYSNGDMYTFNKQTRVKNTSVYASKINDLHFTDINNGTVVGEHFLVRTTSNAGATWTKANPSGDVALQVGKNLRKVWTTTLKNAILVGDDYIGKLSATNVSYQAFTGDISAINFRNLNEKNGYLAFGNKIQKMSYSESGSFTVSMQGTAIAMTSNTNQTINSMHVYNNQNVIAVGPNTFASLYNQTGTILDLAANMPSGLTLNDVFFHDDYNGYVVGNNGVFYRSVNVSLHPTTFSIEGLEWKVRQNDVENATNLIVSEANIQAISFGTRFTGVFGGSKQSGYANLTATNKGYVRTLRDETEQYGTNFYYDRLGRIVASQNARQYGEHKYSYTLYDALGRTYEAGEKTENASGAPQFNSIFGTLVGGTLMTSVADDLKLMTWINASGERREVTRSFYDENQLQIAQLPSTQQEVLNQRNRIVSVTYEELRDGDSLTYNSASHYVYDIHGNVKTLLQENPEFASNSLLQAQQFKKIDYTYDLVSGNVHRVDYQHGKVDEWHHAYRYDADNRITEVYTTKQTPMTNPAHGMAAAQNEPLISPFWEKDAAYNYYKHGPLARVEIGNEKVQGVDYVYTAQGWLKGVNSNTLQADRDPGKDSEVGINELTARDVYGFSLHYNDNDYKPIATSSSSFVASQTGSDVYNNGAKLYNGNIGRMVTTITKPDTREVLPLGNAYQYDQLNRLSASKSFANLDLTSNVWGNTGTYDNKYFNAFNYDANGNILSQIRHDSTGNKIDDLTYRYEKNFAGRLLRNRLYQVNDLVSDATYADDIDDMGTFDNNVNSINTANNYGYDGEGRLTRDDQEEIANIVWRVDGKVREINRTSGSAKKNLVFDYDAFGRRTAKKVYSSSNIFEKAVYYTLDAQGNVMTTYEMKIDTANTSLTYFQAEKHIYGSSRLGMLKDSVNVLGSAYGNTDSSNVIHSLGNKRYELSNHLGNVLTVISDKPIPHNNGGTVDYWQADIKSAYDYSPFGVMLTGRTFEGKETICHDSTVQATQNALEEGFGSWGSWTADGNGVITYVAEEMQISNPSSSKKNIGTHKDFVTGSGVHTVSFKVMGNICANVVLWPPSSTPIPIKVSVKDNLGNLVATGNYTTAGTYSLSFTPASAGLTYRIEFYMANANAFCFFRVDDVLISFEDTTTLTVCKEVESSYLYGFNSMEKDNEVKGRGNSYTTEFRQYDPRLGRWLSLDPLLSKFPWQSPYNGFNNNPVLYPDPTGKEIKNPYSSQKDNGEKIENENKKLENTTNNKQIKKINRTIDNLQAGLDKYNKVESLKEEFKQLAGEEEYNRLDNLTFDGKKIDVFINIENRPFKENSNPPVLITQDGITDVQYDLETVDVMEYGSNKSTPVKYPKAIVNNSIQIYLYNVTVRTLANEFGDADFATNPHGAKKKIDQIQFQYYNQSATSYSSDYERYIMDGKPKPNILNY